ncbi:MAG TPA: methyltransferase domain-containing protein [bacterium]|nr:methyltransferase domain-containing protein [bacterium]
MRDDRVRWDQKHERGVETLEGPPVAYLVAWLPFLPRGRALDLAAGSGRHAIYLAQHGYRVDALDISLVGLARLRQQARAQALPVRAAAVDLDECLLSSATYDLIVNTYYLNRFILPQLPWALVPGGALLVETPLYDPRTDRPGEIARRVGPGELARVFSNLDIAHYEEVPARPPQRNHGVCRMVAFRS